VFFSYVLSRAKAVGGGKALVPRRRGLRTSVRVGVKGRGGQATRADGQWGGGPFTTMNAPREIRNNTPAGILESELKSPRLEIHFHNYIDPGPGGCLNYTSYFCLTGSRIMSGSLYTPLPPYFVRSKSMTSRSLKP